MTISKRFVWENRPDAKQGEKRGWRPAGHPNFDLYGPGSPWMLRHDICGHLPGDEETVFEELQAVGVMIFMRSYEIDVSHAALVCLKQLNEGYQMGPPRHGPVQKQFEGEEGWLVFRNPTPTEEHQARLGLCLGYERAGRDFPELESKFGQSWDIDLPYGEDFTLVYSNGQFSIEP